MKRFSEMAGALAGLTLLLGTLLFANSYLNQRDTVHYVALMQKAD